MVVSREIVRTTKAPRVTWAWKRMEMKKAAVDALKQSFVASATTSDE